MCLHRRNTHKHHTHTHGITCTQYLGQSLIYVPKASFSLLIVVVVVVAAVDWKWTEIGIWISKQLRCNIRTMSHADSRRSVLARTAKRNKKKIRKENEIIVEAKQNNIPCGLFSYFCCCSLIFFLFFFWCCLHSVFISFVRFHTISNPIVRNT